MALGRVAVAGLSAVALACQPLPSAPAASPPPPAAKRVEATPATPLKLVNGQITMRPDGTGLAVFEWDLSKGGGMYLYATSDAGAHWARVEAVPRGELLFLQPLHAGGVVVRWGPLPGG